MTLPKGTRGRQGLSVYQLSTPGVIYFWRYSRIKKREKLKEEEEEEEEKETKQKKYNTLPNASA